MKRLIVTGESQSSLLFCYHLLSNPAFRNSGYKIYLIYEKPHQDKSVHQDGDSKLDFARKWLLNDSNGNATYEIHGYKYMFEKFKNLLRQNRSYDEVAEKNEVWPEIQFDAEKSELVIKSEDVQKTLFEKVEEDDITKIIPGVSMLLHGFGDKVGQVEIDSIHGRSMKGDYYVVNSGKNILQFLSSLVYKSSIL